MSMDADALVKLATYGWLCLKSHREEMADIDGFDAHDWAVATGVITPRIVTESCGDNCTCEVTDFPTECYFIDKEVRDTGSQLTKQKV